MSLYRVEKAPRPATLLLAGGERLPGVLFLSPFSPTGSGPETVEDLLNEPAPLLPFTTADGRFLLVGKSQLAAVESERPASPAPDFSTRLPATLRLAGGHVVEGNLLTDDGPGIRFSDAVNAARPWLALERGDRLFRVSKAHLVSAEERRVEPGP